MLAELGARAVENPERVLLAFAKAFSSLQALRAWTAWTVCQVNVHGLKRMLTSDVNKCIPS